MIRIRLNLALFFAFPSIVFLFSFPAAAHTDPLVRVGVYDLYPLCSHSTGQDESTADDTLFGNLIRHIAKKEGWRLEWITGTLEQGFERLNTNEIDVLVAAPCLQETKNRFHFTAESVISTWAQVFTPPGSSIQSILDLNNKSIGILKNDPYNTKLRGIIRRFDISCRFVEFKSYKDILNALERHWVDAGVVDRIAGFYTAKHYTVNKTPIIFSPIQLGFASTEKNHKKVIPAIDFHLHEQKSRAGSLYHELVDDIFANASASPLFAVLKWSLAAAGVLLISVLIVSLILRRQVQAKTAELVYKNRTLEKEILQRKKAEAARLLLSTAIEQSAESVLITDVDGIALYANPALEKETGYTKKEIAGQKAWNFIYNTQSGESADQFQNIAATISGGSTWTGRFASKKKDGTAYQVEERISPVRNERGTITNYVSLRRDITGTMKLEQQLRQAQKMEAIGTLAGGIAHDFNNILTGIFGYTELALFTMPVDSAAYLHLKEALKAANRAKDLIRQIITFSRQREEEYSPLKVQPVFKEALKLLRASLPSTIDIVQHIDPDAGPILADPSQMHQIIMNLCTNAYHALPSGRGVIEITVRSVTISSPDTIFHTKLEPGPYLCISVQDNGTGIEPEILDRVFDPYFTTKPPGQGSGMGLAVVHGIVKKCGGEVKVNSSRNRGTIFHLYFPLLEELAKGGLADTATTRTQHPEGTETILAVDDEEHVTHIMDDILSTLGYTVVTANSSADALDVFSRSAEEYDLVITDHTMPGMTGIELAEKLLAIRPGLPVILYTGYSDEEIKKKACMTGIRTCMTKPVTAKEIAVTVREALQCNLPGIETPLSALLSCGRQ